MSICFTTGHVNLDYLVKLVIFQILHYFSPSVWISILWGDILILFQYLLPHQTFTHFVNTCCQRPAIKDIVAS